MKITDKEIIDAMTFIKEQHNGELPYIFSTFECAKMMDKYLTKALNISGVGRTLTDKEKIDYEIAQKRKESEKNQKDWAKALLAILFIIVLGYNVLKWLSS
jgi:hypothetical protein